MPLFKDGKWVDFTGTEFTPVHGPDSPPLHDTAVIIDDHTGIPKTGRFIFGVAVKDEE